MMRFETKFLINLSDTEIDEDRAGKKDLEKLKRSIETKGLAFPLVITEKGRLLDGHRRFAVLISLGHEEAECAIYEGDPDDEETLQEFILELDDTHKAFTEPKRAKELKRMFEARQKKELEKSTEQTAAFETVDKSVLSKVWSQDDEAQERGVSQDTISKAIRIAEHVEDHPEDAKLKGKQILKKITEEKKTKTIERAATLSKLSEEETKKRENELRDGLEAFGALPQIIRDVLGSRYTDDSQILADKLHFYMTRVEWYVVFKAVRANLKRRPHYPTTVAIKTLTKTVRAEALKVNKDYVFEEGGDRIYRLVEAALKELANVSVDDGSVPTSERVYKVEGLKK